jgi:hypothetical protein
VLPFERRRQCDSKLVPQALEEPLTFVSRQMEQSTTTTTTQQQHDENDESNKAWSMFAFPPLDMRIKST